jgi:hypothetical protein
MSYKKKKYLYITRRSMHHQHHTTKLRQQHALSVRNAECGHVPHPGIFVLDLEQGTGRRGMASQNRMEHWSNVVRTWRQFKEDSRQGHTSVNASRPSGGRSPAELRWRDSTRLAARSTPDTCASAFGCPLSPTRCLPPLSSAMSALRFHRPSGELITSAL